MNKAIPAALGSGLLISLLTTVPLFAQIPPQITTPDKVETTRFGTLEFKDGAPTAATVQKAYDNLDFTQALNVFLNSFRGASTKLCWRACAALERMVRR
jgi:hypothetical protein